MRVYRDFFLYPDPDQRFLMRIRIRANDTDPKHCPTQMRNNFDQREGGALFIF